MKKVLATVTALGMVLGVAATASALDKPSRSTQVESVTAPRVPTATAPGVALWSVSGQWVLAGARLSDGQGLAIADTGGLYDDNSDDFMIHSFKILPVLQVNDKVSVKGQLRFADRDVFGLTDTSLDGGRQIDAYNVYMEWISPIGKTRFGRTPCGAWGSKAFDSSSKCNRLMLWGNWMPENWGMLAFIQKTTEKDAATLASDQDNDAYYIDVSYKADMGKTTVAVIYQRDATGNSMAQDELDKMRLWMHGKYAWDAVNLEWEVQYDFNDKPRHIQMWSVQTSTGIAEYRARIGKGNSDVASDYIFIVRPRAPLEMQ